MCDYIAQWERGYTYQYAIEATNVKKSFLTGVATEVNEQDMNFREITELKVRINNLKDLLNHTIRYGEDDLSRAVREKIKKSERELIILQTKSNTISYDKTGTPTP
jgi:hypothetical protein